MFHWISIQHFLNWSRQHTSLVVLNAVLFYAQYMRPVLCIMLINQKLLLASVTILSMSSLGEKVHYGYKQILREWLDSLLRLAPSILWSFLPFINNLICIAIFITYSSHLLCHDLCREHHFGRVRSVCLLSLLNYSRSRLTSQFCLDSCWW